MKLLIIFATISNIVRVKSHIISIEVDRVSIGKTNRVVLDKSTVAKTHVGNVEVVFKQAFDLLTESCDFSNHDFTLNYEIINMSPGTLAAATASFQLDLSRGCWLPYAFKSNIGGAAEASLEGVGTPAITIKINHALLPAMHWDAIGSCAPSTKYDLITIILHELVHGLAAYDSLYNVLKTAPFAQNIGFNLNGSSCIPCQSDCWPTCFDASIETLGGVKIVDLCEINPWQQLKIGNTLLWRHAAGDEWDTGTGLSHTAEEGSLMYPSVGTGKCIHGLDASTVGIINTVAGETMCSTTSPREGYYKYTGWPVSSGATITGCDSSIWFLAILLLFRV